MWLDEETGNRLEARWYSYAYLSLREEGRVQVSLQQLEQRVLLLKRAISDLTSLDKHFYHFVSLHDVARDEPNLNPVASSYQIEQLMANGKRCFMVRVPMPIVEGSLSRQLPSGVVAHPMAHSDDPNDYRLLEQ